MCLGGEMACVCLGGEILRGVDGKILGVDMIECIPDIGKR